MRFSAIITFSILLAIVGMGCEEPSVVSKPDQLLEEELYLDIFVEFELLRISQNELPGVLNIDSLTNVIYSKYDVDPEEFLSSHTYYQSQVFEHETRIDTAVARVKRLLIPFTEADTSEADQLLPGSL